MSLRESEGKVVCQSDEQGVTSRTANSLAERLPVFTERVERLFLSILELADAKEQKRG